MLAFLDHVDERHGSIDGLVRDLGVTSTTVDRLRAALLV